MKNSKGLPLAKPPACRPASRPRRQPARPAPREPSSSLEAEAIQIISRLSEEPTDFAGAASHLLALGREVTQATACGLYRAVQDTGLLVPIGKAAFAPGAEAQAPRVSALMARAADHAATILQALVCGKAGSTVQYNSTDRPFYVRSTAPGGYVVWATTVRRHVEPDSSIGEGEQRNTLPRDPQLLGVLGTGDASGQGGAPSVRRQARRFRGQWRANRL